MNKDCDICNRKADETFKRVEVWSNERWRLTMSSLKAVRGFCYLEPRRHIQYITELDGREALELGTVIALVTRSIKNAMGAKLVYVYIYGDHIPHLHIHLAPHNDGDIFVDDVIKTGAQIDEKTFLDSDEMLSLSKRINETISDSVAAL